MTDQSIANCPHRRGLTLRAVAWTTCCVLSAFSLFSAGQAMATTQIPGVGLIIKKGRAIIAKGKSNGKGNFVYEGLDPGAYTICFASDRGDGGSCADATVGKDGVIRGQTVVDDKLKGKKHNYVGHVTLLR